MKNQKEMNEIYKIQELLVLLDHIENMVVEHKDNCRDGIDYRFRNILLYAFGKSLVSIREVIILCSNGFPDGALSLSRNIFEQCIICEYVYSKSSEANFDSILDRYYDDYERQRSRSLKFYYEYIINDEEKKNKHQEILDQLDVKYPERHLRNDYWWSDCASFSNMCEEVISKESDEEFKRYLRFMQLHYKRACLAIHSSYMGNSIRLGSNFDGIDTGAWESGQEVSLFLSAASMIALVGRLFMCLNISDIDSIDKLNRFANYYRTMRIL